MYFDPSPPIEAAGPALIRFASIIDRSALRKRADALWARIDANPFWTRSLGASTQSSSKSIGYSAGGRPPGGGQRKRMMRLLWKHCPLRSL